MSDTFQYREEIDLQKMVDEQARELQRRVDGATLDKAADTLAKFGYVKADGKNRWFELFGTPERAANVILALQICPYTKDECVFCPAHDVCFEHYKGGRTVYEMAEWMRGDAE